MVEAADRGVENSEPKTAAQITQELIGNLREAEFASPIRLAWRDYFEKDELYDKLHSRQDAVVEARKKSKDTISEESELRIVEAEMALLNHDIRKRRVEVPGYREAEGDIDGKESKLAWAAGQEINARYLNEDKSKQEDRTEDLFQSLNYEIKKEAVWGKGKQS